MRTEEEIKRNHSNLLVSCFAVLFSFLVVGIMSYYYVQSWTETIRNVITILLGDFIVIQLWFHSCVIDSLDYNNEKRFFQFILLYCIGLISSIVFVFLPRDSWLFLAIFVSLAMYSNSVIGVTAGGIFLAITCLFSPAGTISVFLVYFIGGLVGIALFYGLDINFRIGMPLLFSVLSMFMLELAYFVIFENQNLNFELLMMPIISFFMNLVVMFLVLKLFSNSQMYKLQDKYLDIIDPEFPLLVEMKDKNIDLYFHAIHTAYLTDRIARKLDLNFQAAKGSAYYFRLARENNKNTSEDIIPIEEQYQFPSDLKIIMHQCMEGKFLSKESCVVLLSDMVISKITQALHSSSSVNYDREIEAIFASIRNSIRLESCDISIKELNMMERIYKEERLYYDFLR